MNNCSGTSEDEKTQLEKNLAKKVLLLKKRLNSPGYDIIANKTNPLRNQIFRLNKHHELNKYLLMVRHKLSFH